MAIIRRTWHPALACRFAGGSHNPLTAPSQPRAERKAAKAQRRSANAAANKQGSFSRGGNADAPERQKP